MQEEPSNIPAHALDTLPFCGLLHLDHLQALVKYWALKFRFTGIEQELNNA